LVSILLICINIHKGKFTNIEDRVGELSATSEIGIVGIVGVLVTEDLLIEGLG
jgi:hypothetical protein